MFSNQDLQNLTEDFIQELEGVFIVDTEIKGNDGNQTVVVLLDGDNGIDIDQCAQVSRALGNYLEENEIFETKYRLEVSSPGVDTPLKNIRQYIKNIGRDLVIETSDLEKIKGKLIRAEEEVIVINELVEQPKKANTYKKEEVVIPIKDINKAKVLISFS
ncbi:ribosome maturation factor RimP [Cyclobacteriaceae bacterium]|nr:ribosome maturation factor RimP [Cyclobacteriaceae bacterium]